MNDESPGRSLRPPVPRLRAIYIAPARGQAMRAVSAADADAGRGLVGDRYHAGRGTFSGRAGVWPGERELSLIDTASVCRGAQRLGRPLDAQLLRRNLLVDGLCLAEQRGGTLRIGEARIVVVGRCPPCGYLSRLLSLDMKQTLHGLGGVRARIAVGGRLTVGDAVVAFETGA